MKHLQNILKLPGVRLNAAALLIKLVVFAALLSASACSSVSVVKHEKDFTFANIESGGFAIGAVTRRDTINYYAEPPIAHFLEDKLKEEWPDVKILGLEKVTGILGTNVHTEIRKAFFETASLDPAAFPLLEGLSKEIRYLLLVNMLEDETQHLHGLTERPIEDIRYNPQTDRYESHYWGSEYTHERGNSRTIHAAFVIYDLQTSRDVWIATVRAKGGFINSETDRFFVPRVKDTGNVGPTDLLEELGDQIVHKLPRKK